MKSYEPVNRPPSLAGYRCGNGALCLVVCDDPMLRERTNLACLAQEDCFIAAKPVERVAGQIGWTQKATWASNQPRCSVVERFCNALLQRICSRKRDFLGELRKLFGLLS